MALQKPLWHWLLQQAVLQWHSAATGGALLVVVV